MDHRRNDIKFNLLCKNSKTSAFQKRNRFPWEWKWNVVARWNTKSITQIGFVNNIVVISFFELAWGVNANVGGHEKATRDTLSYSRHIHQMMTRKNVSIIIWLFIVVIFICSFLMTMGQVFFYPLAFLPSNVKLSILFSSQTLCTTDSRFPRL